MIERVWRCMDRIAELSGETAVIVAHGGSLLAVVQWWLRLSHQSRRQAMFEFAAASLTELGHNRWHEPTVVRLNDTGHLAAFPNSPP